MPPAAISYGETLSTVEPTPAIQPKLSQARAFTITSGNLYVVGGIQQTSGDDDIVIRHYDAAGERDEAFAVAVAQNRVFVAGRASLVTGFFGNTAAVQAYSADTGELFWADYRAKKVVNDIVAQDERVIVVGARQSGRTVVRANEASRGNILWRNAFGSGFSPANSIDMDGQLAYVGGHANRSVAEAGVLIVRAVDLTRGRRFGRIDTSPLTQGSARSPTSINLKLLSVSFC